MIPQIDSDPRYKGMTLKQISAFEEAKAGKLVDRGLVAMLGDENRLAQIKAYANDKGYLAPIPASLLGGAREYEGMNYLQLTSNAYIDQQYLLSIEEKDSTKRAGIVEHAKSFMTFMKENPEWANPDNYRRGWDAFMYGARLVRAAYQKVVGTTQRNILDTDSHFDQWVSSTVMPILGPGSMERSYPGQNGRYDLAYQSSTNPGAYDPVVDSIHYEEQTDWYRAIDDSYSSQAFRGQVLM